MRLLKRIIYKIFRIVRLWVSCLFPKDKHKILFDSFPDYSDNARALSEYICSECKYDDYKIYWAVKSMPQNLNTNRVKFFVKNGRRGKLQYIYHTITAKYLFSTHGAFGWVNSSTQKYICLWHGTPLKRIARMQNPNKIHYMMQCRCFIAPSAFYKDIFAKSFGRKIDDVIVTGYPRNDLLFKPSNVLESLDIQKHVGVRMFLYMPTFRQPAGGGYSDTSKNVFEDDFIRFSDEVNMIKWNSFFKEHNILFIVKPHPSDSNSIQVDSLSNIRVITNHDLEKGGIQLYSLLHYADALITDFSSVFCDYMLLDRPIGFLVTDLEQYSKGRGFVFDNPVDYMPGPIIQTEDAFIDFCSKVVQGEDSESLKRKSLFPIYNDFYDANSCKRIVEYVDL